MNNATELIDALNQISNEKGIDKEVIFEAIETSLVSACKKNFGTSQNIRVVVNRETGHIAVFAQKEVVESVSDVNLEISLEGARKINADYGIGDMVDVVVTPKNFGRISAQTAKQVVVQKFREAEREILYNEYITKEKDIVTGIVQRRERKNVIIALGKIDAVLQANEQIPKEDYNFQDRIKVYVTDVKQTTKGPVINVSRTHPELVKRLFEQEVPEVYDGVVEIKSIAREAGNRTKIAVSSKNPDVDAVGACVGQNGSRVNVIVDELNGEKIDISHWSSDPREYIASALSPSKVLAVVVSAQDQSAKIVVPDNQLSLAIGKEGQNARLAAKLTGWRIDIKSESQAKAANFISEEEYQDDYEAVYDEYDDGEYDDLEESYDDDEYDDSEESYDDGEYDDSEESYDDSEYDDSEESYDDSEYDDADESYGDNEYDDSDESYDDDEYYDDTDESYDDDGYENIADDGNTEEDELR